MVTVMSSELNNILLFLLLVNLKLSCMYTYKHEKPVAEVIFKERCTKHSMMLNDCNWCRCVHGHYSCDARVCRDVDMFGHFNDAIRDINVGMEGHGAWRAGQQACEPGVHYQRNALLCICTEDGAWANPVCRDTFRVLHPVEPVTDLMSFKRNQCEPTKLYLVGCNVCFCPADSIPNPKFCTTNECSDSDPVFGTPQASNEPSEVYAQCDVKSTYKLGCRSCVCLSNNRLLCGSCRDGEEKKSITVEVVPVVKDIGSCRSGGTFKLDCNLCLCLSNGDVICTTEECSKRY